MWSTKHRRSAWFDDLEEIGDVFEIKFRKENMVGIVLYQVAKLRMLQFYYDFLDYFIDRRDFELIQMDTDSMFLGFSCKTFEEAVPTGASRKVRSDKKELVRNNRPEPRF